MFIICEGGDGVGKSSLAQGVAELLHIQYPEDNVELLHRGPPERDVLAEYAFDVDDYRPLTGRHIVADRWHLGTLVYAELYRKTGYYGELGLGGFRWVELFLKARGAGLWLVDHPTEKVRERLRLRGEDYLKDEHLGWCLDRFREVERLSAISHGAIDTSGGSYRLQADLARSGRFAETDHARFNDFPGYVGGSMPHTLLVGERHGGKPPHASQSAFIPTGANSGRFLLEALPDPFWRGVGLVNAYETDVHALLNAFDIPPHVVALGGAAHKELTHQRVQHGGVPHPQYVRRFQTARQEEYGALIKEVSRSSREAYSWPK